MSSHFQWSSCYHAFVCATPAHCHWLFIQWKPIFTYNERYLWILYELMSANERCQQTTTIVGKCSFKLFVWSGFINNERVHLCINMSVYHIYNNLSNIKVSVWHLFTDIFMCDTTPIWDNLAPDTQTLYGAEAYGRVLPRPMRRAYSLRRLTFAAYN